MIQDIQDIKAPVEIVSPWLIVMSLILTALLVTALVYVIRAFRKKIRRTIERARSAHEIAYEQLESLSRKDLISAGRIKEYFSELSDIVRHYLENRFDLKAPDMTTEEFLLFARDVPSLARAHRQALRDFLTCCDLVKFARYSPSPAEIDAALQTAKKFIDETAIENKQQT